MTMAQPPRVITFYYRFDLIKKKALKKFKYHKYLLMLRNR